MMSGEQKVNIGNIVFKGVLSIVGCLGLLILNDMHDDIKVIKNDVVNGRIKDQNHDDRIDVNSNAINEIKHSIDYLEKTKLDK